MAGKQNSTNTIPENDEEESGELGFEFVTVTITARVSENDRHEGSRKVRVQAMHDYLRKQNKQSSNTIDEAYIPKVFKEPAQYNGRFKLKSWTHKARTKSLPRSQVKEPDRGADIDVAAMNSRTNQAALDAQSLVSLLGGSRLNSFNSPSIILEARSERLIVHYE
ncbi:hypothetical protein NHQ30_007304 [Ciborinia camelliae]|nr:hypothetical protein NHQ30_007304 [Ciborinia camelliae]